MSESPNLQKIDLRNLKTVCIALGPYRNLTTLIASILFLHPNCQVLNHAGIRILTKDNRNFLLHNNLQTFKNFLAFAIKASIGGSRADYGGSITLSHAFDDKHVIGRIYQNRYGNSLIKNSIHCFFWKESLRVSNFIRKNNINLSEHFQRNRLLRFLMPIRNPLDCAMSNLKGKVTLFTGLHDFSPKSVLTAILKEFAWFLDLKRQFPDRFFYFFEHDFNRATLEEMAGFLGIETEPQWVEDSLQAFEVTSPYKHSSDFIEFYKQSVKTIFKDDPVFLENLLKFTVRNK